jgi:cytochrome P450
MIPNARNSTALSGSYPPGPRGHWLLGTAPQFQGDLLQMMVDWMQRYGDAIRFRYILFIHGYLFCHPDHYHHILVENRQNYQKYPNPIFEILKTGGGDGLLTSEGATWLRQRRLMQPAFHRQSIARFSTTMTQATAEMLVRWNAAAEGGDALDIAEEMIRLALEVSGKSLFSVDLTREAKELGEAFAAVSSQFRALASHPLGAYFGRYLLHLPFLPSTYRFRRDVARLDDIVSGIIAERKRRRARGAAGKEGDLLATLLDARDEVTGEGMSDQQLRDEVTTLLLTSHETVAAALAATLYLLAEHPQAQQTLAEEVAAVLGGRRSTMDDIDSLLYTKTVVKESLRLFPPVYATTRTSQGPDLIDGYEVPANALVTLSPYLTHRHPDFWEEPDMFHPERFAAEGGAKGPEDGYIPFGRGPRSCIGGHFAMTELMLVVPMVLQRYWLEPDPAHEFEMKPLITLHPHNGIWLTLQRRE